MWNLDICN